MHFPDPSFAEGLKAGRPRGTCREMVIVREQELEGNAGVLFRLVMVVPARY